MCHRPRPKRVTVKAELRRVGTWQRGWHATTNPETFGFLHFLEQFYTILSFLEYAVEHARVLHDYMLNKGSRI
jgi:hypothetical protein